MENIIKGTIEEHISKLNNVEFETTQTKLKTEIACLWKGEREKK